MTLKFDEWAKKTIGHPFYTISSFVHHFKFIGLFKLELQSRNAQFGSKSAIFLSCVTLKFDRWPCKTIGHLFYTMSNLMHHFKAMGEFKLELQSGNAQFRSKLTIFCPVWPCHLTDNLEQGKSEGFESCDRPIVRKRPIWVKIGDVLYRVTLKFDGWPWKTIGHLYYATSSDMHHFVAIGQFKLSYSPETPNLGQNRRFFLAVWPCNLTYDLEKQ